MSAPEYLRIGRIVRAHGVRGDVKLEPTTDDPSRFLELREAFLEERGGGYRPAALSGARLLPGGAAVLHIAGVDTCEAAEALRGRYLCVDRAHAVALPPDTYFVAVFDCMAHVCALDPRPARRILLSPRGRLLTTERARALAGEQRLILLCGHYEGVDERVMAVVDEELSIGDYVLTGGELPAMVLIDCVSRFVPGVLGSAESALDESHAGEGLLEYPQYTRPAVFRGMAVPEVLLSGHHANIAAWRRAMALQKTQQMRPELLGAHGRRGGREG